MAAGDSIKASYCDALALRSIIFQAEEKTDWGFFVVVFYRISKSHIDFFFLDFVLRLRQNSLSLRGIIMLHNGIKLASNSAPIFEF